MPHSETPHHAEDLQVGSAYDLGSYTVTRDEIVAFARQWDPQGFHVDDEVAAAGFFGEVIASGVHSVAILQRLCVLGAYDGWAVVAGRDMADLRFRRPVRPGTELAGHLVVESVDLARSDRGTVAVSVRLTEQDAGEEHTVLSLRTTMDVWRRGHGPHATTA